MKGVYRDTEWSKHKKRRGFTIIELLIVVVVIAILAAITVVSYNGITGQAKEAALKSDLRNAATQLNAHRISDGGDFPSIKPGYVGDNLNYFGSAQNFCVFGEVNNRTFYADEDGNIREGVCPPPVTMQAMTPGYCVLMPVYTGSNPEAVLSLTDNRGGTVRNYEVAKLADNKCWMLTNLKLGSTSSTIPLTPADSSVASNFTLPQLSTSWTGAVTPVAWGPVTGDTGVGATNYGYLYNWSAATSGASEADMPAGSGNAPYSICPFGWRLPTSGNGGDFSVLNAKMNNPSATTGSSGSGPGFFENWQSDGRFKGTFSGSRTTTFSGQGSWGRIWSSTASTTDARYAYYASIAADNISPAVTIYRVQGHAVRCVLN